MPHPETKKTETSEPLSSMQSNPDSRCFAKSTEGALLLAQVRQQAMRSRGEFDFRRNTFTNHKSLLKSKGWSYRSAAPRLNVSYQHLSEVLNGKRQSRRLLAAIESLPLRFASAK